MTLAWNVYHGTGNCMAVGPSNFRGGGAASCQSMAMAMEFARFVAHGSLNAETP